jgi:hypothetical protein
MNVKFDAGGGVYTSPGVKTPGPFLDKNILNNRMSLGTRKRRVGPGENLRLSSLTPCPGENLRLSSLTPCPEAAAELHCSAGKVVVLDVDDQQCLGHGNLRNRIFG